MMWLLNRLRGTWGWMAKVNGIVLGLLVYFIFGDVWVALAVCVGYIVGESFGWGAWVGTLTSGRTVMPTPYEEGKKNGIQWMATKIVDPMIMWRDHCRLALIIRGLYWWLPTLAPLYFVGFNPLVILGCIAFLSVGFPIACETGYLLRDKISFEKYGLSYSGGWEIQEGFYGLMQDMVLITLVVSYVLA